jgi:rod shape-determining protein MreC
MAANERLYNKLKENYQLPDTVTRMHIDSIRIDSILQYRQYNYTACRVISNSVSAQNNFIILNKGRKHGLQDNRGIVDQNNNVVGKITEVSDDYAVVMSLLHKDSRINGKLLKAGETGTVIWDGEQPNVVTLTGIAKSVKIAKGDSVITSGFSTTFPKGLLIGRVEAVFKETSSNSVRIRIRTAANFHNLQYAYAIDNIHTEPVQTLLDKLKKQQ